MMRLLMVSMAETCANRTHPRRSARPATALKAAGPTRDPSVSIVREPSYHKISPAEEPFFVASWYFFCAFPFAKEKKRSAGLPTLLNFLAERWGFEPQIRFWRIHDFQSCSFGQLGHLSV